MITNQDLLTFYTFMRFREGIEISVIPGEKIDGSSIIIYTCCLLIVQSSRNDQLCSTARLAVIAIGKVWPIEMNARGVNVKTDFIPKRS